LNNQYNIESTPTYGKVNHKTVIRNPYTPYWKASVGATVGLRGLKGCIWKFWRASRDAIGRLWKASMCFSWASKKCIFMC